MAAEEGAAARDTARPFPVDDTRALAEELESLGGAKDVAVGVASVYCSVCPAPARAAALRWTAARQPRREVCRTVDEPVAGSGSRALLEVDDPDETRTRAGTDVDGVVGRNDNDSASTSSDAAKNRRRARRYRLDGVAPSGGVPDAMWRDVADWLHRGFDAVVVAHGQSGSGKTRALFGDGGGAHQEDRPGLTSRVVRALFAKARRNEDTRRRFAVSAWEMSPNGDVLDLLDPSGLGKGFAVSGSGSFGGAGDRFGDGFGAAGARVRCVEVKSADECEAALALARRASKNWTVPARKNARAPTEGFAGTAATPRPGRAHAFFRLTIISAADVVAELQVADLIGAKSLALASVDDEDDDGDDELYLDASVRRANRRDVARQLLAFGRVVDELASRENRRIVVGDGGDEDVGDVFDASSGRASSSSAPLPSSSAVVSSVAVAARESRLTRFLAPLLAAGARLFFLACVSPLDVDRLDTLETMRVAQRAARLRSACVRRRLAPEHERGLDADFVKFPRLESLRDVLAERARDDARYDAADYRGRNLRSERRAAGYSIERDGGSGVAPELVVSGDVASSSSSRPGVLSPNRPARLPVGLTSSRACRGTGSARRETRADEDGSVATRQALSPSRDAVEAYLRLHERATLDALASNSLRDFESDADASVAAALGDPAARDLRSMDLPASEARGDQALDDEDDAPPTVPRPLVRAGSPSDADESVYPHPAPRSRERSPPEPTPDARLEPSRTSLKERFSELYAELVTAPPESSDVFADAGRSETPESTRRLNENEQNSPTDAYGEFFAVDGVEDAIGDTEVNSNVRFEPFDRASDARLGAHELRRRLDALTATLGAERRSRSACEEKLAAVTLECETRVLEARAETDSSTLEAAELRRRHDLLLESSPEAFKEVFARYERDVAAAERECARLRRENLDLTVEAATATASEGARNAADARSADPYFPSVANISSVFKDDTENPREPGSSVIGPEAGIASVLASRDVQRRLDRLCAALRKSEDARAKTECENAELRRRERVTATRARAFEDAQRRLRVLETQCRDVTEATREAHLATARANALRHEAEERLRLANDALDDAREDADRATADAHRANARCHELEASFLERRAAAGGATLLARDAALASARAAVNVPDQPSLLKMAAELRSAATRAASAGDASALAEMFDAFVDDIERGFEASRSKRVGAETPGGEKDTEGAARAKTRDAEGTARSETSESRSAEGDDATTPLSREAKKTPRRERPPETVRVEDDDHCVGSGSDAELELEEKNAVDADPEPVLSFGGPTSASSALGATLRGQKKIAAVSKKLTLRPPPPDIAAAAAAAAAVAARRALAPRAPFATDETYDFLFDPPRLEARDEPVATGESVSKNAQTGRARSPYLPAPLTPNRRRDGNDENASTKTSPGRRARKEHSSERIREADTDSPPEARLTSSVGGLVRFKVGRSPSPSRRRFPSPAERGAPASPSSLARSPPGSPRAFYPAGRRSVYEHGSP